MVFVSPSGAWTNACVPTLATRITVFKTHLIQLLLDLRQLLYSELFEGHLLLRRHFVEYVLRE